METILLAFLMPASHVSYQPNAEAG